MKYKTGPPAPFETLKYYLFHAICAGLLRRLGRMGEAIAACQAAAASTENPAERALLERRIEAMRSACA